MAGPLREPPSLPALRASRSPIVAKARQHFFLLLFTAALSNVYNNASSQCSIKLFLKKH